MTLKKRDVHTSVQIVAGNADASLSTRRHRKSREQVSGRSTKTKDRAHANTSRDGAKKPSSENEFDLHAVVTAQIQRDCDKDQHRRRNQAARLIQQAWRR